MHIGDLSAWDEMIPKGKDLWEAIPVYVHKLPDRAIATLRNIPEDILRGAIAQAMGEELEKYLRKFEQELIYGNSDSANCIVGMMAGFKNEPDPKALEMKIHKRYF